MIDRRGDEGSLRSPHENSDPRCRLRWARVGHTVVRRSRHLAEITLIDKRAGFVFGFSKLDVMFGKHTSASVFHPYESIAKPGVRFVQATIESIDPGRKVVTTDAGEFDADVLVIALGADLDPSATPGLVQWGHEFYTVSGAFALRRRPGVVRGRTCRHRCDIDPVQVPPGTE